MPAKTKTGNTDPKKRALLLSALYLAQEQFGWLSPEAIRRVADRLDLSTGQVVSAASFYSMFRFEPQGRYHIQVCEGLSCYLLGTQSLLDYLQARLGLEPGETSLDGKVSFEVVQCLAACDVAPALKVNDELFGSLTIEKIDILLENLGIGEREPLAERNQV